MHRLSFVAIALLALAVAAAGSTIIIPPGSSTTPGAGSLGRPLTGDNTTQFIYASTLLTGAPLGSEFSSIAFRADEFSTASGPVSFDSYTIILSSSNFAPGLLSNVFDNNIGADAVTVYSGPLTLSGCPTGSSPNAYCAPIRFQNPYTYLGGDLLVTVRHTSHTGAGYSVDAVSVAGVQNIYSSGATATTSEWGISYAPAVAFETPEPATAGLIGAGLAMLAAALRRRSRSAGR